jgi:hypothetical protein
MLPSSPLDSSDSMVNPHGSSSEPEICSTWESSEGGSVTRFFCGVRGAGFATSSNIEWSCVGAALLEAAPALLGRSAVFDSSPSSTDFSVSPLRDLDGFKMP